MSYTVNVSNGSPITILSGTSDVSTGLTLVGKNVAGYGQIFAQNFVTLMQNFAGSSPPNGILEGQLWYDTGTYSLKIYKNGVYRVISTVVSATTAPPAAYLGDMWWDTANNILKIWNNTNWIAIGPYVLNTNSAAVPDSVADTNNISRSILKLVVDTNTVAVISSATFNPLSTYNGLNTIYAGVNLTSSGTISGGSAIVTTISSNTTNAVNVNASNIGNTSSVLRGASLNVASTINAATINATAMGNAATAFTGASFNAAGSITAANLSVANTITAATVNAATIGNSGATLTGTLSTAAQTNVTSVGNLTALSVTGNVGIGTTSPQRKIDIEQLSTDYQVRIGDTGSNYYDIGRNTTTGLLTFYGSQTVASGYKFSTVNGDRLVINTVGNMGLGISPTSDRTYQWLQVAGNSSTMGGVVQTQTSGGEVTMSMFNTSAAGYVGTGTNHPLILRVNSTDVGAFTTSGTLVLSGGAGSTQLLMQNGGDLVLNTSDNSGSVRLYCDAAGQLSFNNTMVGNKTSMVMAQADSSLGNFAARAAGTGDTNLAGMTFWNDAFAVKMGIRADGYIGIGGFSASPWKWFLNCTTGDMTASGNVAAYSDPRLKENFIRLDKPFDIINKIDGGTFTWKDGFVHTAGKAGKRDYGILADQVAAVMPEIVSESIEIEGERYKTVAYDKLVPVLLEAIKELNERLSRLEGK